MALGENRHAQSRQQKLGAIAIPAAGTDVHPTIFENLAGALAAMFYADFASGSGGTSVKLY